MKRNKRREWREEEKDEEEEEKEKEEEEEERKGKNRKKCKSEERKRKSKRRRRKRKNKKKMKRWRGSWRGQEGADETSTSSWVRRSSAAATALCMWRTNTRSVLRNIWTAERERQKDRIRCRAKRREWNRILRDRVKRHGWKWKMTQRKVNKLLLFILLFCFIVCLMYLFVCKLYFQISALRLLILSIFPFPFHIYLFNLHFAFITKIFGKLNEIWKN